MILRTRQPNSCPKSLNLADSKSSAFTELEAVRKWIDAGRPNPKDERPEFKAYKSKEIGPSLEKIFDGKCAYCESPYSAFHPVDVEHWRPKAEVEDGASKPKKGAKKFGYEWLAMRWENLLPSCIDCNRARRQKIPHEAIPNQWQEVLLGKANQFPVELEANRWTSYKDDGKKEVPLLLDPTKDQPSEYFDFRSDGVLVPKHNLPELKEKRASASIRVYALNRKALVDERRRHILWMEVDFGLVRFLYEATSNQALPKNFREEATLRLTEALEKLRDRTLPAAPYSQFIAQRLRQFLQDELGAK